VLLNFSHSNCW